MMLMARQGPATKGSFAFVRGSWGYNTPRRGTDTRPTSNYSDVSPVPLVSLRQRTFSISRISWLDYPGLGRSLRYNDMPATGQYAIGTHACCVGAQSEPLPAREVAMMSIMERLTDKENWQKKIFDKDVVARWRDEALAIPDSDLWNMLDPDESVVPLKGILNGNTFDCCVQELQAKAVYYEKSGIIPTLDAYASVAKSDRLVSPELHQELRNAFATIQRDQASSPDWHPNSNDTVQDLVHPSMYPLLYGRSRVLKEEAVGVADAIDKWAGKGEVIEKDSWRPDPELYRNRFRNRTDGHIPSDYWSDTYQWLPSNLAFQNDGSVRFTSYINNLHPTKYPEIYQTIEKLIAASLPAWDQCLALHVNYNDKEGAGRMRSRFVETMPKNLDDTNPDLWTVLTLEEMAQAAAEGESLAEQADDFYPTRFHTPIIPEPASEHIDYGPGLNRLIDRFQGVGLQVIVKMASIELEPNKPEFPGGGWHVEGQMNEHICATALYYLDSENITSSNLSFRVQTPTHLQEDEPNNVGQQCYNWMEQILGTGLGDSSCVQYYGSVETRQGRLLAFPNVFQHRVSPFRLIDETKPGHRRFIALWLVDPNRRIISTANVPPQQQDWLLDSDISNTPETRRVLMGAEEAKEHRLELMQERATFVQIAAREWENARYDFCEH